MSFFYNTDSFIDNEFGALDNATLDASIKAKQEADAKAAAEAKAKAEAEEREKNYYKVDPKTGLSQAQIDAKAAQAEAALAREAAAAALKSALAEQARLRAEAEARAKAEADAAAKANADAKAKAEAEARARAEAEARARAGTSTSTSSGYVAVDIKPAPAATPSIPLTTSLVSNAANISVKTAPIDTVLTSDDLVIDEALIDLLYEDIGGHEIINIARNDTINGQTVRYQPIKNLSSIQQQYNPNNILALQNTSDKYFQNFSIKLETKLLEEEEGSGPDGAYVYIEPATGDLIVELINLETDEQIEIEIGLSGTIYEAEFNES